MENLTLTESQLAKLTYPAPAVGSKKYGIVAKLNTETFVYEVYLDAFVNHIIDEAFNDAPEYCYILYRINPDTLVGNDTKVFLEHYKSEFERGLLSVLATDENLNFLQNFESSNIFADIAVAIYGSTQSHVANDLLLNNHQNEISTAYANGQFIAKVILLYIDAAGIAGDYCLSDEGYQGLVKRLHEETEGCSIKFIKSYDYNDKMIELKLKY